MFSLINCLILTPIIGMFIYLDGHRIVKNTLSVKFNKFRKINKLVSTRYKGVFTILRISVCMICQALWISAIQYMNSSVVPIKNGEYVITYVIKGKIYKMTVKPVKGPRKVLMISNENQDDVSGEIFPYLGPGENFHNTIYTPDFFGCGELVFEMSDGNEKIFKNNDKIILKGEF